MKRVLARNTSFPEKDDARGSDFFTGIYEHVNSPAKKKTVMYSGLDETSVDNGF